MGTVDQGSYNEYDPSLEFPGDDSGLVDLTVATSQRKTLRLLITRGSQTPKRRVAVIDGHDEVSIGRDTSPTARLRLKEMAVSKFHATIFWDSNSEEWSIVDVGSVHGTFISSNGSASSTRLSRARTASAPRPLKHLDEITIGSTTLLCHIHDGNPALPCDGCSPTSTNEIPLFIIPTTSSISQAQPVSAAHKVPHKRALADLKTSLLSRSAIPRAGVSASSYVDRAARRRAAVGISIPEPRQASGSPGSTQPPVPRDFRRAPPSLTPSLVSNERVEPISEDNIGHRMLTKQGWKPGAGLGLDEGSAEIIETIVRQPRAGLGSR
jgi:pSer/pThr/pTyr-binding forkhead associated (FHA) protein